MAQSPDELVSDDERDDAVRALREGCGDGRLTLDEFSERAGAALAARTRGDLDALLADLPTDQELKPAGAVAAPARRRATWTVAIMGSTPRRGRWRPARRTKVLALMGGCHLDLRRAEVEGTELTITAVALMGGIDIVVPEGIEVELSGVPVVGSKGLHLADVPTLPCSPVVRVQAFPIMGGVNVRSRPPADDGGTAP